MGSLFRDVRLGLRTLVRSPGFTLVAVLSLALGIGANAAIFQLLDSVRMRSLPVPDAQRLSEIRLVEPRGGVRGSTQSWNADFTFPVWETLRDHRPAAFAGLIAWARDDFNVAPIGEIRHAKGLWVSGDFFQVLRVQPILGRVFEAADDRRGCGLPGAVVSYAFWQRELAGDAGVIGKRITIDFSPVEVIGVTPASFTGLEVGETFNVALPICAQATISNYSFLDDGTIWWLTVVGRLNPGATVQQATAQLSSLAPGIFAATLPKKYPRESIKDYLKLGLTARPARTGISELRGQYEDPLWLLLVTAGLVLLIACANLANLMLARASVREREFAVRLAIGASRARLVRQLTTESAILAAAGAGLGVLLAGILSRVLVSFLTTQGNDVFLDLDGDWRVLAFTAGVGVATCVLFGLAPAWRAIRTSSPLTMQAGGRGYTADRGPFGLRRVLAAAQVALALVLLFGGVLFSRSLRNLVTVDLGFRPNGLLVTYVDLRHVDIPFERRVSYKLELLDRLRAIPGVDGVADVRDLPMTGSGSSNAVWVDGADPRSAADLDFDWVSRDYFRTMTIPLIGGRDFDNHDTPTSPPVAIVNEAFARRLGLGSNPVGRRFRREATPWDPEMVFEVVGLVGDSRYRDIYKGNVPIAYLATSQDTRFTNWYVQMLVRSHAAPAQVTTHVRQAVRAMSPLATTEFAEYESTIRDTLMRERLMAALSGFFGVLAALLATVGLYGVMSYLVARRTNEIGIRMTLGADRREVIRMVLREAGVLIAAGLGVGLVISVAGSLAARAMVYGVRPYDPPTLGAAAALLAMVALAASYLPARRAARLDPAAALRDR